MYINHLCVLWVLIIIVNIVLECVCVRPCVCVCLCVCVCVLCLKKPEEQDVANHFDVFRERDRNLQKPQLLVVERLSARQLILHRVSIGICIYIYIICIYIYIYISVTLNCVGINGEGHTLVLYVRGLLEPESVVGSCFC